MGDSVVPGTVIGQFTDYTSFNPHIKLRKSAGSTVTGEETKVPKMLS